MSLLLDALKEAELRQRATQRFTPAQQASLDVEENLALVSDTDDTPTRATPSVTAPPVPPLVPHDEQATRATASATAAPGQDRSSTESIGRREGSRRLFWLVGLAGVLTLSWGAAAVYEALTALDAGPIAASEPGTPDAMADLIRTATPGAVTAPIPPPEPEAGDTGRTARPAQVPGKAALQHVRQAALASQDGSRANGRDASAREAALPTTPAVHIERHPDRLAAAYAALQAGDLERARAAYAEVLQSEPGQVDAELGLAVIAHSRGEDAEAARRYRRVLESIPDHPRAWAGLAELAAGTEAAATEARLRQLLASRPAAPLHFALGNLLARQQRWADAQTEFFAAAALAPQMPDYVVNLAIALDRLGKTAAAASQYERALELAAAGRAAGFDTTAIRARLVQLR